VIGFPLRLLARENYDRAARLRGRRQVALVTGEEKIVPAGARYFFCTVESMPVDRPFDFLAVDEIQLCGDAERGHVFTDRLLHARGQAETMFLGADTIRPLLRKLVPEAELVSRPRFSTLSYLGPRKLTRLPPRSAVIAFSAAEVYALAELMRRQSGGTAVVLGALSPRTRNAQVELFEAGEERRGVAGPEDDAVHLIPVKRDLGNLAVIGIDRATATFGHPAKEPVAVESRDIGAITGRDDHGPSPPRIPESSPLPSSAARARLRASRAPSTRKTR